MDQYFFDASYAPGKPYLSPLQVGQGRLSLSLVPGGLSECMHRCADALSVRRAAKLGLVSRL